MKALMIVLIATALVSTGGLGAYAVIDSQGQECSITYVLDGGTNGDNPDRYISNTSIILDDATKEGYTFGGWYLDKEMTKQIMIIHEMGDVKVYANWTLNDYALTIHYVFDDLSEATEDYKANIAYNSGYSVMSPIIPFYTADKPIVSGKMPAYDVTETVTYTADIGQVTYVLDGGTNSPDNPSSITIEDGEIALSDPTRAYFIFGGWFSDEEFTDEVTSITYTGSDITLYAKWTAETDTITYVLNGGKNSPDNPTTITAEAPVVLADPSRTGHTFGGWFSDDEFTDEIEVLTYESGIRTLYAKWTVNSYTLTIHYVYEDLSKAADDYIAELEYGTEFYVDSPKILYFTPDIGTVYDTMGDSDITETVTYIADVGRIAYELDGGTNSPDNPETFTILDGEIVLEDATKEHYTFDGWFADDEFSERVTSVTYAGSDITLYAKWIINVYEVTYILNGGINSPDNPDTVTIDDTVVLSDPVKEGYGFILWVDENGDRITEISGTRDITITALWIRDLDDTITSYSIGGTYTESKFIIFSETYEIKGLAEYIYLSYDEERGYRYSSTEYIRIGDDTQYRTEISWTDDLRTAGTEYVGIETVDTIFGDVACFVLYSEDRFGNEEYQYFGCVDGIEYRIFTKTVSCCSVKEMTKDLMGIMDLDRERTVTVTVYDGVGITTAGGGQIKAYSDVTLTAETDDGTIFKGWYDPDGELISEDPVLHYDMLRSDLTLYALNDEYYDVFTEYPEISLDISDITGIEDLHDISWELKDGGSYIPGEGDTVEYTFSEYGPKSITYSGTDSEMNERSGFILIWYERVFSFVYYEAYGDSDYLCTIDIRCLDCQYYEVMWYPDSDAVYDGIEFVTDDCIILIDVRTELRTWDGFIPITDIRISESIVDLALRMPYITDDDMYREIGYWASLLDELSDCRGFCEFISIIRSASERIADYGDVADFISDYLAARLWEQYSDEHYLRAYGQDHYCWHVTDHTWGIGDVLGDPIIKCILSYA